MVQKKVIKKTRKNEKKMEREVKLILGGIGAIALLLAGIIVVLTVDFGPEEVIPEPEKHPNLFIDEVRFVNSKSNTRSNEDDHTVEATVFFTNNGDATSKGVELEIFAMVTKTNMAEDSESVKVGDVASMKTKKATFNLDLPKGNEYKIDLLVFEDGMITKKGYGTVKIEEETDVSAQQFKTTESNKNWNSTGPNNYVDVEEDRGKEAADSGASIMIVFLVLAIIFVIVVLSIWAARRKEHSNENTDKETHDINNGIPKY
ncbi:MAG: hypothetical protein QGH39_13095 [Candidatus Thermoplasmatota archaeon]|jgi:lipopolysaccharide export LptBFGC system permease protein LptF|nr:hypothetical protein [Candidatus Thermoplasmatota archaeon]